MGVIVLTEQVQTGRQMHVVINTHKHVGEAPLEHHGTVLMLSEHEQLLPKQNIKSRNIVIYIRKYLIDEKGTRKSSKAFDGS